MAFFFKSPKKGSGASDRIQNPNMVSSQINQALKILTESAEIVNTTTVPSVFFGRMNTMLDALLFLQQYELIYKFKNTTPTQQMDIILNDLNSIVNAFIDRSLSEATAKANALKTEKGRRNSMLRYADSLLESFQNARTYWAGNNYYPHYTDALFTPENLSRVEAIRGEMQTQPSAKAVGIEE